MIIKYYIVSIFFLIQIIISNHPVIISTKLKEKVPDKNLISNKENIQNIYKQINEPELNFEALTYALKGYEFLKNKNILTNDSILTIIDYSKSSIYERFYVIDIYHKKILFKSLVAHGKNSGMEYATSFSNKKCSKKSSVGLFLTGETYYGKHGFSLRINGLENNINNNARERAIVIHSAGYVNRIFIKNCGHLGRSFGCPALPIYKHKNIINTIKNRSCLFIYYPDKNYLEESEIISDADFT